MEGEIKSGHYEIGKKIASGGMGDVFRARDIKLDRPVAFKVIKPEYLKDPQFRERFGREARAAAAICHPGIAQVYDYEDDGKLAYIVYELVEGQSLQKRLAERRATTEEILDIGIKAADAVAAIHEKSFIHRDLKPGNIMLTPRPDGTDRVRILDFGLVKQITFLTDHADETAEAGSLTRPGMQPGTIEYMSPEQLRSERVDQRSDIHAMGLVLYEMATGINPFRGNDSASTISNILTREPPPLTDRSSVVPTELDRIIRRCLRKNPQERYVSARELLTELSNLRKGLGRPAGVDTPRIAAPAETWLAISRNLARLLFVVIQVGYLAMYIAAASYLPHHPERVVNLIPLFGLRGIFFISAMCGAAVRLYFLSTVGFDYPDSGRLFRRIFPIIALLDSLWAATPLLLYKELEGLAWVGLVGLAFLPFSQRSLIYSAYAPHGGKTSGVEARAS